MNMYQSITIIDAMNKIATNEFVLPAIQRKFVWTTEQIENLFDSIMRNYPINSFMLWKVSDEKVKKETKFYTFLKDYCQRFHEDNTDLNASAITNDLYAIIDGQQRLTSLYIGLFGKYRKKEPSKWWIDNQESLPDRHLYLELTSEIKTEIDNSKIYNFRFLTKTELEKDKIDNPSHFWFKVSEIIDSKFKEPSGAVNYLKDNNLLENKFALSTLTNFASRIHKDNLINYYPVEDQDLDKVLDIFVRANSGGTMLTFSDLLLSISTSNWKNFNAREEIKDTKEQIAKYGNPAFNVSQDLILKSMLTLTDSDVRFKILNFNKNNINLFENNWERIKKCLISTFELLEQLGFNDTIIKAKNAIIPIAYYIYINNLENEISKEKYITKNPDNIDNIRKWLIMALLKGIFGGSSDAMLVKLRNIIKDNSSKDFPFGQIIESFKTDPVRNYMFDDALIESLLESEWGSINAGLILNLLYPEVVLKNGKEIAEDHMHPKSMFSKKNLSTLNLSADDIEFYLNKKNYNSVLNLQLLSSTANKSKSSKSLKEWYDSFSINAKPCLYVDSNTSLELKDFRAFLNERKDNLTKRLKEILK